MAKNKKQRRRMTTEAVIHDKAGRVLLVRQARSNGGRWELPGGKVKKRESLPAAIAREVKEETGLDVTPHRLLGIFYVRDLNIYDFVVECILIDDAGSIKASTPEITACKFFALNRLPKLIAGFTVDRINDAREDVVHLLPIELSNVEWVNR